MYMARLLSAAATSCMLASSRSVSALDATTDTSSLEKLRKSIANIESEISEVKSIIDTMTPPLSTAFDVSIDVPDKDNILVEGSELSEEEKQQQMDEDDERFAKEMLAQVDMEVLAYKLEQEQVLSKDELAGIPKNPHCEFCNSDCSSEYLTSVLCFYYHKYELKQDPQKCLNYIKVFADCYEPYLRRVDEENRIQEEQGSDNVRDISD